MSIMTIPGSKVSAYRAAPSGEIKGAVIVIHEIWGLVPHIESVADRFAEAGYLAVAPDILSQSGVTPLIGQELHDLMAHPDEAVRTATQPVLREKLAASKEAAYAGWALEQLRHVVDYLEGQPGVEARIAVTGFCFGGSYAFALAAADPRIRAAVPFYGAFPEFADAAGIRCPIHAFYGDSDERIMAGLPAATSALEAAGVDFTTTVYPGRQHAFFNDTNSIAYDEEAADDAWARTLAFLDERLTATAAE